MKQHNRMIIKILKTFPAFCSWWLFRSGVESHSMGGYFNPYVYVLFILLLPWKLKVVVTCSGIDYRTYHRHVWKHQWDACCSFCVCGLCPTGILRLIAPRDGYEAETSLTPQVMGINWFITYVSILVLLHHLVYFTLSIPVQRVLDHIAESGIQFRDHSNHYSARTIPLEDPQKKWTYHRVGRLSSISFFLSGWFTWCAFLYQVIDDSYKSSADNNITALSGGISFPRTDLRPQRWTVGIQWPVYDLMIIPKQAKNMADSLSSVDWSELLRKTTPRNTEKQIVFSGETFAFRKQLSVWNLCNLTGEIIPSSRAFCFAAYASQISYSYCSAFIRIHWWGRQFNHQKKSILQGWWLYREKWNWTGLWIKVERTKRSRRVMVDVFNREREVTWVVNMILHRLQVTILPFPSIVICRNMENGCSQIKVEQLWR